MANQIANNMSSEDKEAIENMDMEKMISHVTKNIFKMMNDGDQNNNMFSQLNLNVGNQLDEKEPCDNNLNKNKSQDLPKTRDIAFDLNINLEDFYIGKKKKIVIKRKKVVIKDGVETIIEDKKKIVIPIERGMRDEQQIRFEGEADDFPGYIPGDIVITLIENEHPIFQRDGDNLVLIKNINLYEVFKLSFVLKHLDSRILKIENDLDDPLHSNDSLRIIKGEGMPIYNSKGQFGDLFIRFNIIIPRSISTNNLPLLKKLFHNKGNSEETNNVKYDNGYILEHVSQINNSECSTPETEGSEGSECSEGSEYSEGSECSECSEESEGSECSEG